MLKLTLPSLNSPNTVAFNYMCYIKETLKCFIVQNQNILKMSKTV